MDLESYNKVINGMQASEDPSTSKRKKSRSGFSRAEISFKKDLLRGKIVWHNDKKKDWKCYIRLNHPALSICGVPKQHPFGKTERFAAFMIDFGLSAVFAFVVGLISQIYCDDTDTDTSNDCPKETFDIPPIDMILYGQLYSLIFSIINAISNGCVKSCATCACCQKDSCPKCCRRCAECFGDILLFVWLIAVLALCFLFGSLAWYNNEFTLFMLNFIGGRLWSWVTAFITMRICFNKKWKKERANKGKKLNKFKVTYIDYELYVNGNQVEIPPHYRPNRTNTIGSIGSEADLYASDDGRASTVGSPVSTSPRSQSNASVQMSPVSPSAQTIYVDANGNPIQMAPDAQPTIVYVQAPPVASSVASSHK